MATLVVGMLVAMLAATAMAAGDESDFERHISSGRQFFEAGRFDEAIKEFRSAVRREPNDSMAHLWLGRATGRKAERSNFALAVFLARRVRSEFERAVALDPENLEARSDLLEFYVEAPRILGGGIDKARREAEAIARLDPEEGRRAWARIADKEGRYATSGAE